MTTSPTTATNMQALAVQVVQAEQFAEQAAAILKAAKDAFILGVTMTGERAVEVDGVTVTATDKVRRNFDVAVLASLVPHTVFEAVTKIAVHTKAFDAARELGEIDAKVEDAVTVKRTPYTEVRVTKH